MKILSLLRLGTTAALACSLCGCETAHRYSLTYKLWDKGGRPMNRPASDPRLEMFASEPQHDVLVAYDAVSERRDKIERHAYFVFTNEARVGTGQPPRLVDPSLATNLISVPLVANTNTITNTSIIAHYPVKTDHGSGFELYRDGQSEGTYSLPVYREDSFGTASQVALTPLAVVGDTVTVVAVVATFGAFFWIKAGAPPYGRVSSE